MIYDASTLLSTIANLKASQGGFGSKETITVSRAWMRRDRRGVTIACAPTESFTDKRHYTSIVAPRYGDFIQNMTTGALQADTAQIMVPADGNSATSIAEDHIGESRAVQRSLHL